MDEQGKKPIAEVRTMKQPYLKSIRAAKLIVVPAVIYALASFAYSVVGLFAGKPTELPPEYTVSMLAGEVLGHFIFGFLAGVFFLDLWLALLTGALAVLIDTDHVLHSVFLPTTAVTATAHSILFGAVSCAILYATSKRLGLRIEAQIKFAFLGYSVLFSHIAYDVFGGVYGFLLLDPFSFQEITIPASGWFALEALAIAIALAGTLLGNRYSRGVRTGRQGEKNRIRGTEARI